MRLLIYQPHPGYDTKRYTCKTQHSAFAWGNLSKVLWKLKKFKSGSSPRLPWGEGCLYRRTLFMTEKYLVMSWVGIVRGELSGQRELSGNYPDRRHESLRFVQIGRIKYVLSGFEDQENNGKSFKTSIKWFPSMEKTSKPDYISIFKGNHCEVKV